MSETFSVCHVVISVLKSKIRGKKIAVVIFNFTSAHVVEDFEFDWQKRILKFYFKTHTHTAEKNNQQAQTDFLFSTEKQFYYKYFMWTDYDLGGNYGNPVSTF